MSGMEIPIAMAVVGAGATVAATSASASAQEKGKQATLMAAQEQSAAQEFEAGQLDIQGRRIRSAGAADEAARRSDLVSSLDTIQVLRAGRGLDPNSPTGRAIMAGVTSKAETNIASSQSNYALQASNSELQAELSRRKARYSLIAGDASASAIDDQIMATYAGGVGKIAGIGMSFGKSPVYR